MQYTPPRNGNQEDPNRPYVNAEPALSIEGSIPVAEAFEHHQRELVHLIEQAGLEPSSSDLTQVAQAVLILIQRAFPEHGTAGQYLTKTEDGMEWTTPELYYLEQYRKSRIGHIQSGDIQGLPGEFCIADGRLILFENYPELHEKIIANKLRCIGYDSTGIEREKYIGCYMYNETKTGVFVPSVGGYFERYCVEGQEIDIERQIGTKQDDAIRNITGKSGTWRIARGYGDMEKSSGCFLPRQEVGWYGSASSGGDSRPSGVIYLDASRVVPTASDNRPYNIAIRPVIYLGKVVDARR